MHGADPVHRGAELPIPAALAAELTRLWAAIEALRQDMHRPVQNTVQSLPEPLFDDPADNTTERWNLYLKFQALPGAGPVFAPRLLVAFGEQRDRYVSATDLQQ
jgi:hypothetical protein